MRGQMFSPDGVLRGFAIALSLTGPMAHSAVAASLSPQDLQVLGHALAFVQPRPGAEGTIAIVYSAGASNSRQDAEAIMAAIGKGLPTAGAMLVPRLVDAGSLATTDFDLVIVAAGANSDAVMRAVRARHALCVTADELSVREGVCTMAIRSGARVEIFVNSLAARQAGIGFTTAFRMMVREL
jgi:hypothetical protein